MKYFLVGPNNTLTYLPDCKIEEGKRELVEIPTLAGSDFVQGRKRPDVCVFKLPDGVGFPVPCIIVDQYAMVYRVIGNQTEIGASKYIVVGYVEEKSLAPDKDNALIKIQNQIAQLHC